MEEDRYNYMRPVCNPYFYDAYFMDLFNFAAASERFV